MLLRWTLRTFSMLLLLACIGAWIFSHFAIFHATYEGPSVRYGAALANSAIYLLSIPPGGKAPGWEAGISDPEPRPDSSPWYFLGFNAGNLPAFAPVRFLRLPLWFLTTLSLLLALFIYRKTRPLPTASAFPVEPSPAPLRGRQ